VHPSKQVPAQESSGSVIRQVRGKPFTHSYVHCPASHSCARCLLPPQRAPAQLSFTTFKHTAPSALPLPTCAASSPCNMLPRSSTQQSFTTCTHVHCTFRPIPSAARCLLSPRKVLPRSYHSISPLPAHVHCTLRPTHLRRALPSPPATRAFAQLSFTTLKRTLRPAPLAHLTRE